jgi:lipoyl(octanoyl) transferase
MAFHWISVLCLVVVVATANALSLQQLGSFEPLLQNNDERKVLLEDWIMMSSRLIPYQEAWNVQKDILEQHSERLQHGTTTSSFVVEDDASKKTHNGVDRVFFLQHAPVYTLGTASKPEYIKSNPNDIPIIRMDRGGEVTYHGPGQLTVYPVLDLRSYRQDIHWYMRALEECVLIALHKCGIENAYRDEETTGVWVQGHKVAAMGVKCKRWITQHGLAVNVQHESLEGFQGIVPCGLEGCKVGCVNQFLDRDVTVEEFSTFMRVAMEEVFCIRLI